MKHPKKIFFVFFLLLFVNVQAQKKSGKDTTTNPQTVTIISKYQPKIKSVAKINFAGSQLSNDTSKNIRSYNIPVQNLFYAYTPITISPLSLVNDTLYQTGCRNYVRVGAGNFKTAYLNGAASFGNVEQSLVNIYTDYLSSKGKIINQDFSNLNIKGTGSYFNRGHELFGSLGFNRKQTYFYGYNHELENYQRDSIRQQFLNFQLTAGVRNFKPNDWGLNYSPQFTVDVFSNKNQVSENTFQLILPVEKSINETFTARLNTVANITKYETKNLAFADTTFHNNTVKIAPGVYYSSKKLKANIGIDAVSNEKKWVYFPNIYGEMALMNKRFLIIAGWQGDVIRNTYKNLVDENPFISVIRSQKNTIQTELFGGIKSSIGKNFIFSGRAGLVTYKNFQIFINDTSSISNFKYFVISNEPSMTNFKLHGDFSYLKKGKFSFTGGATINGYTGMKANDRAWNTLPLEANASLRWKIHPNYTLRSDFLFFAGGHYLDFGNVSRNYKAASDWSVGIDAILYKRYGAFLNLNNIFGKSYERWHNYPVYGMNVLAGLQMRF